MRQMTKKGTTLLIKRQSTTQKKNYNTVFKYKKILAAKSHNKHSKNVGINTFWTL